MVKRLLHAPRPRSLRLRITLYLIVAIVVTLGTANLIIDHRVDNEVAQRADVGLLEQAQALTDIYNRGGPTQGPGPGQVQLPSFLADDGVIYFRFACQGQTIASSPQAAHLDWPGSRGPRPIFADIRDTAGTPLRAVVLPFKPQNTSSAMPTPCVLALAVNRDEVDDFQESLDHIEFGCVVVGFLAVIVLVPLLVARGLHPLKDLADAMERIGPEDPKRRLPQADATELAPLSERFNEVLSRMEQGLLRERQFAASVAHELRTPLAELHTMIEVELRYPGERDPRQLLQELGTIGREMESLVSGLLLLTRIEAGIESLQRQPVDIQQLTRRLGARYVEPLRERGLTLESDMTAVTWLGDPALFEVLLGNLLGNACAYAPAHTSLQLTSSPQGWQLANRAPALRAEDLEMLGARFWRKDRDTSLHAGLGLTLAKASASALGVRLDFRLHDGWLHAHVSPPMNT